MLTPHAARKPWMPSLLTALRVCLILLVLSLVGGLIAKAPVTFLFLGMAALLAAALLLYRPWLGLCGLALAVPFGPLVSASVGGLRVTLAEALLAATLLAWYLRATMGQVRPAYRGGLWLAIGAMVLMAVVAVYPAQQLLPAVKDLAKWLGLAAVFFLASSELTQGRARWVVAALLLGGAAQGLLGIYQFMMQRGPEGFQILGQFMRAHGTFGQPNPYGGYLGLLLPLGYALPLSVLACADEGGCAGKRGWLLAALAVACACLAGAGLALSWSRGALLGALVALAMVILAWGPRARLAALAGGFVLLVIWPWIAGLLPPGAWERLWGSFSLLGTDLTAIEITDANFAVIERLAHWQAAWGMFTQRPWLGVGLGQYVSVYPTVAIPRWSDPLGHAHSMYLHVLAEQGLLGATALAVFLMGGLAAAAQRLVSASGWRHGLALGCWGMLWHLIAHSVVDLLFVQGVYLLIGLVLGLMVVSSTDEEKEIGAYSHGLA